LSDDNPERDNLIPFPQRRRVLPPTEDASLIRPDHAVALIEHDGRLYDLAALLQHLSPQEMREIDAAAPRPGQELWAEVARRWPALAAEIVAGARPTG
jgi:hemin uptake protein HemP